MRWVRGAGRVAVAVALVSLFAGQIAGQPVLVSFVETGSMAPTLAPEDGFVAIPAVLAGPVETGDVVTYRAETVGGGGLTTHRVVGETAAGFRTRGDANPFTDQSAGEPPVTDARIVAVALQIDGRVVAIPAVGRVATATRGGLNAAARPLADATGAGLPTARAAVTFLLAVAAALLVGESPRERSRSTRRMAGLTGRRVTLIVTAAVVCSATAAMVLPAGATAYEVVSAESDAPGPRVIPAGTSETTEYVVGNRGFLPVVVFLSGEDGVSSEDGLSGGEEATTAGGVGVETDRLVAPARGNASTTVTLSAPPETGLYRFTVTERRYLAVLPVGVIATLHDLHPLAPLLVIDAVLAVAAFLPLRLLVGNAQGKRRARDGPSRLWGWFS